MESKKYLRAILFLFVSTLIVKPGVLGKTDAGSAPAPRFAASSAQQPSESQKQEDSQMLINRGEEFMRLKQYDQAIRVFKQTIRGIRPACHSTAA
jgi:hypothetical protein